MVDHRRNIGCTAGRLLAVSRPIRNADVTYSATDVAGAGQLNISRNHRTKRRLVTYCPVRVRGFSRRDCGPLVRRVSLDAVDGHQSC
jgi:hypothetical protein